MPTTCNPATGACEAAPAPTGTACSDMNLCTLMDTCNGAGACVGPGTPVCEGGTTCSPNACNPLTGQCNVTPATDGTSCGGTGICEVAACSAGVCQPSDTRPQSCSLTPLLTCVRANGDGSHTAVLGYSNTDPRTVHEPIGSLNQITEPFTLAPQPQPTWFSGRGEGGDGTRHAVFAARFNSPISWQLGLHRLDVAAAATCSYGTGGCASDEINADGRCWPAPLTDNFVLPNAIVAAEQTGGQVAGNTPGGLAVSHDGAAQYHLPIQMPVGRGGFVPRSFSLEYDSNAGNGIAGVGFRLNGPSQIHRCPMSRAYGDAEVAPVNWGEPSVPNQVNYALCLDGKRLIRIPNGTTRPSNYRLEDDPTVRITILEYDARGPRSIEVKDGNGNTYTYGGTPESRGEAALLTYTVRTTPPGPDPIAFDAYKTHGYSNPERYSWAMSGMTNRFNQSAIFSYATGTDSQEGYERNLTSVIYDGNQIVFDYGTSDRPDPQTNYVRGMKLIQRKLLREIRTYSQSRPIREYRLAYEAEVPNRRARLSSVTECDGQDACRAPIVFGWQDAPQGFTAAEYQIPLGDAYVNSADDLQLHVADVDADGRDDLLLRVEDGPTPWTLARGDGNSFEAFQPTNLPSGTGTQVDDGHYVTVLGWDPFPHWGQTTRRMFKEMSPGDMNGDGQAEIGLWNEDGSRPRGYQFWTRGPDGVFGHYAQSMTERTMSDVLDMNADGRAEVIVKDLSDTAWKVRLGSEGALLRTMTINGETYFDIGSAIYADTDGDHNTELLLEPRPPTPAHPTHYDSFRAPAYENPGAILNVKQPTQLRGAGGFQRNYVLDANGDGISDLIVARAFQDGRGPGMQPYYEEGIGNGYRISRMPGVPNVGETYWPGLGLALDNGVRVADLDADGRDELLVFGQIFNCLHDNGTRCGDAQFRPRSPFLAKLRYDGTWTAQTMFGLPMPAPLPLADGTAPGANINGRGYRLIRMIDVNGDGLPEILMPELLGDPADPNNRNYVLQLYRRNSDLKPDLLTSVTDSLGARSTVSYRPMSDPAVHTKATGDNCSWPLNCRARGRWLVREVIQHGGPAEVTEVHSYTGGRVDRRGRGWLGFATHVVENEQRGSHVTFEFDNHTQIGNFYPYAGQVKKVRSRVHSNADRSQMLTVETETTLQNWSTVAGRLLVRPSQVCERRYQHAATAEPSTDNRFHEVCTDYRNYDEYGFAHETQRVSDVETRSEYRDYQHNPDGIRILGILRALNASSEVPSRGFATRSTSYESIDTHGLPNRITTLLPFETNQSRLVTTYARNAIGQITMSTVVGEAGGVNPDTGALASRIETRITRTEYDDRGFPRRIINPLGHREEMLHDPAHGVLLAESDENGATTRYTYDTFGRVRSARSSDGTTTRLSYTGGDEEFPGTVIRTTKEQTDNPSIVLSQITLRHNQMGWPVRSEERAPRGRTIYVDSTYDPHGRVLERTVPTFDPSPYTSTTKYSYDGAGRILTKEDSDGTLALQHSYVGNAETVTNAADRDRIFLTDELDRLAVVVSHDENDQYIGHVHNEYIHFDAVERTNFTRLDGTRQVTTARDGYGRIVSASGSDRPRMDYVYNAFGEQVFDKRHPDAAGESTYDALGRVRTTRNAQGLVTQFDYDRSGGGIGAISLATRPMESQVTYRYDAIGRPTGETLRDTARSEEFSIDRSFDGLGRLMGIRYPAIAGGARREIQYDYSTTLASALRSVTDSAGAVLWTAEDFSPHGTVSQEMFGNGLRVQHHIDPDLGLIFGQQSAFVGGAPVAEMAGETPGLGSQPRVQDVSYWHDNLRNLWMREDRTASPGHLVNETYTYAQSKSFGDVVDRRRRPAKCQVPVRFRSARKPLAPNR